MMSRLESTFSFTGPLLNPLVSSGFLAQRASNAEILFSLYLNKQTSCYCSEMPRYPFNTLRPRQNGRRFPDVIFKCIFLNENVWISIKISLNFVPKGPINNIPSLVQIMAWRRPGDKPLSEPMMVTLLTHICVTRPQWVNATAMWLTMA